MAYGGSVPYDNDPRPLKPTNKNLRAVRESEGPNPTQDGPHRGTGQAEDALGYLDTAGPEWDYLGHFVGRKVLEEGHNTGAKKSYPGDGAVSKKISHLVKSEGRPQRQAVAMALSMKRAGRLTKSGGYRRAK